MDGSSVEGLIEQANAFDRNADMFREAARKLRDAAKLLQLINQNTPNAIVQTFDGGVLVGVRCEPTCEATTSSTTTPEPRATTTSCLTTPPPLSTLPPDRLAQLNQLLRELGPSQRHVIIEVAAQRGIPKSTTASYVTRDNFDYDDGFWYIKGTKKWPPKAYRLLAEPVRDEVKGGEAKLEIRPSGEE